MTTSTIVLLIYILFLVPAMLLGFGFARRKLFRPHHKLVMTGITLTNWVLIIAVMIGSYGGNVAPYLSTGITQPSLLLPTLHLITGAIAQSLATYLVILMWFEKSLPKFMVTHKIKTPMRLTLSLWLITAVLGLGIYIVWNAPSSSADSIAPVATDEVPVATDEVPTDNTAEPVSTDDLPTDNTLEPVITENAPIDNSTEPVATDENSADNTAEPVSTSEANTNISIAQTRNLTEAQPVSTPEITSIAPIDTPNPDDITPVATPDNPESNNTPDDVEPVSTPDISQNDRIEAIRALLNNPQARREWIINRWQQIRLPLIPVSTPDEIVPVATADLEPVSTPDVQPVATDDNGGDDNNGDTDNSGHGNNNNDDNNNDDNNNDDNNNDDNNDDDKKDD